jgi:hypothetical protein
MSKKVGSEFIISVGGGTGIDPYKKVHKGPGESVTPGKIEGQKGQLDIQNKRGLANEAIRPDSQTVSTDPRVSNKPIDGKPTGDTTRTEKTKEYQENFRGVQESAKGYNSLLTKGAVHAPKGSEQAARGDLNQQTQEGLTQVQTGPNQTANVQQKAGVVVPQQNQAQASNLPKQPTAEVPQTGSKTAQESAVRQSPGDKLAQAKADPNQPAVQTAAQLAQAGQAASAGQAAGAENITKLSDNGADIDGEDKETKESDASPQSASAEAYGDARASGGRLEGMLSGFNSGTGGGTDGEKDHGPVLKIAANRIDAATTEEEVEKAGAEIGLTIFNGEKDSNARHIAAMKLGRDVLQLIEQKMSIEELVKNWEDGKKLPDIIVQVVEGNMEIFSELRKAMNTDGKVCANGKGVHV